VQGHVLFHLYVGVCALLAMPCCFSSGRRAAASYPAASYQPRQLPRCPASLPRLSSLAAPLRCPAGCENFLYSFKAARRVWPGQLLCPPARR
jgi:hypothetical protein